MTMRPQQMVKLLMKNGFVKKRKNGTSHLIMYNKNKNISVPVPIHSGKESRKTQF
ncbi:type II toxin-antitoxin system HicA family toxin [Lactobacillus bombicola]|uniref:type II toxin-antitoxin system HicA family toxin n=1 Tax=Lactobacillus bombicola TaxID=1505723 RepID=UPI0021756B83|nr:type II toxin-antitoxin system HicA family toxin [Lactobacillus bombicola]